MEQRTCLFLSESLSCTFKMPTSEPGDTTNFFKVNHTIVCHVSIHSFVCVSSTDINHYGIRRRVFRQTGFINGLTEHWGVIISIQHSDVYDHGA
uniref:Uncharacterized protein n=1 Tax=Scophthalmus maximus TaxID=52904 RepID=A0A8D3DDZ2_SCOMX